MPHNDDDIPPGWEEVEHDDLPTKNPKDPLEAFWEWLHGPTRRRAEHPVGGEMIVIENAEGERRIHHRGGTPPPVWEGPDGGGSSGVGGSPGRRRLPPRPTGRSWLPLTGPTSDDRRYYLGDEWRPASGAPDVVLDLQDDLVRAGLLPAGAYRRGVWDVQSASAYAMVLRRANVRGVTADEELGYLGEHPMFDPGDRTLLSAIFEQIERTRAAVSRPSSV